MSGLRVSLFGGVRVEHHPERPSEKVTRGVQALLGYLLLHRHRMHSREVLSGVFWGDQSEDSARCCLNTALWRLRQVLEPRGVPRGTYLIKTPEGEVGFNPDSPYWLDVAVLERGAKRIFDRPSTAPVDNAEVEQLEAALEVYAGDLMQGNYSDWALRERERLRELYLTCLGRLVRYHRDSENFEKALTFGQRILGIDPLREDIHREMMRLFLASGQRALALRQYETCREVLASELGIEPMEETDLVHSQIARPRQARAEEQPLTDASIVRPLLQRLHAALRGLDQAREHFQGAMALLDQLTDFRARKR